MVFQISTHPRPRTLLSYFSLLLCKNLRAKDDIFITSLDIYLRGCSMSLDLYNVFFPMVFETFIDRGLESSFFPTPIINFRANAHFLYVSNIISDICAIRFEICSTNTRQGATASAVLIWNPHSVEKSSKLQIIRCKTSIIFVVKQLSSNSKIEVTVNNHSLYRSLLSGYTGAVQCFKN